MACAEVSGDTRSKASERGAISYEAFARRARQGRHLPAILCGHEYANKHGKRVNF
jgi:hypothetical protein